MLDLLQQTVSIAGDGRSGGVLVIKSYAFGLLCDCEQFLFDNHAHRLQAALAASVLISDTSTYLKDFFQRHYAELTFSIDRGHIAGHLTFLKVWLLFFSFILVFYFSV